MVKATVPPGFTDLASGLAVGRSGIATVGVINAPVNCVVESATTYLTGDACPVNVGKGSKVTVPFAFTL